MEGYGGGHGGGLGGEIYSRTSVESAMGACVWREALEVVCGGYGGGRGGYVVVRQGLKPNNILSPSVGSSQAACVLRRSGGGYVGGYGCRGVGVVMVESGGGYGRIWRGRGGYGGATEAAMVEATEAVRASAVMRGRGGGYEIYSRHSVDSSHGGMCPGGEALEVVMVAAKGGGLEAMVEATEAVTEAMVAVMAAVAEAAMIDVIEIGNILSHFVLAAMAACVLREALEVVYGGGTEVAVEAMVVVMVGDISIDDAD
ncbi:glycine-rich protein DOT1-like [Penaeus monodon]|uniref:glycine-rich protein DOT1-like n=1 Tax=Penaeus monodon TaxID=6687 RepID=UPI0018A7AB78|nr:glycine-rich protein DOT1-like [Penaeus monodon]